VAGQNVAPDNWIVGGLSATRKFPSGKKDSFERNLLPQAEEIAPKTTHTVLDSQTQNVAKG
jgi:hypothetical protein